jgi:hypothetical protein
MASIDVRGVGAKFKLQNFKGPEKQKALKN